jgi:glutamate racemase
VTWIDPAPAIARRMVQLIGAPIPEANDEGPLAVFTSGSRVGPALRAALKACGLSTLAVEPMPMVQG